MNNSLAHLKEIGREISRGGYSFTNLQQSASLFWDLLFTESFDIEQQDISFVGRKKLREIFRSSKDVLEAKIIYPLLPPAVRDCYSLNNVISAYQQSREAQMFRSPQKKLGLYENGRCYVLDSLGRHLKNEVAFHETVHRRFDQYWQNSQRPALIDFGAEEEFCRRIDYLYSKTLFDLNTQWFKSERKDLNREYKRILNPVTHDKYIAKRVTFYRNLLSGVQR